MEGAEAPEDVMAVLRDYVQEQYTGDHEGLLFVEGGDFVPAPLEYDDWRIESIEGPLLCIRGRPGFCHLEHEL